MKLKIDNWLLFAVIIYAITAFSWFAWLLIYCWMTAK